MEFVLFLALVITVLVFLAKRKKLLKQIDKISNEFKLFREESTKKENELLDSIDYLNEQNGKLSKYQAILDAEKYASNLIADANNQSSTTISVAKGQAEELLITAKNERIEATKTADEIKSIARKEAAAIREKANEFLANATHQQNEIIKVAKKRAEEIAGDAYKALQNAESLEQTARAMKNVIEGYGDKYIVPTYGLLDELAEEFGHEDAGKELKLARERTKLMLSHNTAAKCDYVELNRKETAVNFVLDAFNGKVDTILSTVKRDNYGTLEQKIKDAFQIVNYLGKAFRNACITDEYLRARLAELKWSVIVNELKWNEREEQRLIKEQIREEEKARREFERAIKEAEKEEAMLKKAIEKAQREVEGANEAQRAKYEEQLRVLNEKLQIAEEKNQRAISMAQQTKSGNVYIISNIGSFGENVYKIGMTRRLEPLDRIRELGDASVPFEFDVHSMIYSDNAPALERELHKKFLRLQMNKVNPRKEFFKVTLLDIRNEVEQMGINAKWTMSAEARQYKESLAIEQAIKEDPNKQQEWMQHQIALEDQIGNEEIMSEEEAIA